MFSCQNGSGVTGCGRQWGSVVEIHCVVCHEQYASELAFDRHPCEGLTQRGRLYQREGRYGPVWTHPDDKLPAWLR